MGKILSKKEWKKLQELQRLKEQQFIDEFSANHGSVRKAAESQGVDLTKRDDQQDIIDTITGKRQVEE